MTRNELEMMTVLQLRKVAKEHHVILGAGIDKAGIVAKIFAAVSGAETAENAPAPVQEQLSFMPEESAPAGEPAAEVPPTRPLSMPEAAPMPAASAAPVPEKAPETGASPKYQAAWHNTQPSRYNARSTYQAPGGFGPHAASWGNTPAPARSAPPESRMQPTRPGTGVPRFGPAPASGGFGPRPDSAAGKPQDASRSVPSPLPERRYGGVSGDGPFEPRATQVFTSSYTPASHPAEPAAAPSAATAAPEMPESEGLAPSLEELLASGDFEVRDGILELHPDGYGFLRSNTFLPSSRDIYVSMAQIRRFGLRTGDKIIGKVRPQREGDKYAALLYINSVNGVPEEESRTRPIFDELTPVYPSRRIPLESADGVSMPDMRLIDLIAPIGFGQRALLLCPPNTGKAELMQHMATVIHDNDPDVDILMILIDVNPEDVTMVREAVPCQVLASTFDQPPEAHLRLSEIVLERAMRLVEQKKDVVLLVDSLTKLAKVYTTAAAQQGRSLPGMVNPASLFRAKRLFGAARACKEGGSLTVIAAMDIATGSKVDDSVVEEFKGTANMELTLDMSVARAGVRPALNLQHSYTKNADILLDKRQKEGLTLIRTMLGSTSSAVAIPQLESMMNKAATNEELLLKMKDWFALMNR